MTLVKGAQSYSTMWIAPLGVPAKRSVVTVVAVLGSVVALALEILRVASANAELGEKVEQRREKRASQLEAELVWRSWSELQ